MSLRVLFLTYKVTFLVHLLAIVCTLASLWLPNWIDISFLKDSGAKVVQHVGLAEKCVGRACVPFPQHCRPDDVFCALWHTAAFTMWITVVLQFASAIAYASPALVKQRSVAPLQQQQQRRRYPYQQYQQQTILSNGEEENIFDYEEYLDAEEEESGYLLQSGWKIISYFLAGTIVVQGASVATVQALFKSSPHRFIDYDSNIGGSEVSLALGASWWLALLSCAISVSVVVVLIFVGCMFNRTSSRQFQVYLTDNESETEDEDESRDFYYYIQRSRIENMHRSNSIASPS